MCVCLCAIFRTGQLYAISKPEKKSKMGYYIVIYSFTL